MDKEFFNKNEKRDYQLLEQFNKETNLFTELYQAPKKHYYDASGKTRDGRTVIIEIKNRNQVLLDDGRVSGCSSSGKEYIEDTLFIENNKSMDILMDALHYNQVPLYVNFLQDGTVIIHNLLKLKRRPKRYENMAIRSKGYQKMEIGMRQGLYIDDACIYKNNRLIKKCNE